MVGRRTRAARHVFSEGTRFASLEPNDLQLWVSKWQIMFVARWAGATVLRCVRDAPLSQKVG